MFADMVLGVVLIVIAGLILVSTSQYPDYSKITQVGPGVIPSIMAYVILAGSFILVGKAVYQLFFKRDGNGNTALAAEKARLEDSLRGLKQKKVLPLIGIAALMLLFALLYETVGLELLCLFFLFFSILLCGERRIHRLILIPVLGTGCFYIVFVVFLKIPLRLMFL